MAKTHDQLDSTCLMDPRLKIQHIVLAWVAGTDTKDLSSIKAYLPGRNQYCSLGPPHIKVGSGGDSLLLHKTLFRTLDARHVYE